MMSKGMEMKNCLQGNGREIRKIENDIEKQKAIVCFWGGKIKRVGKKSIQFIV